MKHNIKSFIYLFLSMFALTIIAFKLFGFPDRYDLISTGPYSWIEIYNTLPLILLGTLIITVLGTVFNSQAKKNEDWRMNEARKRIAEREKHEKEAQEEKQKENKNKDDKQEKKSDNG